jgi:tripeptide aminopeptidase
VSDDRLLQTFLDLVRIDSPTGHEGACAAYCAQRLRTLGFEVRFDDSASATGSDTGNLIALRPGTASRTLALSAHMDCVDPCLGVVPKLASGVIVSEGETVLGGDDKACIAAALEAFARLVESGEPTPTLRAVFSVQEEIGLVGAKHLRAEDAASDLCLVLDADGAPGGIVTGAPTHYTFAAEFFGRSSHAGVEPERGVSAVLMAVDAISRMRLGRLDEGTTANVGSISGGTATNVIPARCLVKGECRSLDRPTVENLKAEMDAALHAAAERAGGSVDVNWNLEYESFSCDEDSLLVKLVWSACEQAGLPPHTYRTGGGSDANVFAAIGVPVLALACGMQSVHSTREQLEVRHLDQTADLCVAVARLMAEGQ